MLGGTPRCERCGGAVYHAEQVMGPGRRIYHKLCLKCESCGKRLDQGSLVQHDNLPYCNRCHTQLFGTRDLRHSNLYSAASPGTSPARPRPSGEQETAPPPRLTPRPVQAPQEYYTPPAGMEEDVFGPTSSKPDEEPEVMRVNFRAERPMPSGVSPAIASGLATRDSPRSKAGVNPGFEDRCKGCEKRVYAAEQVFAIGQKWHRGCLRCNSCRTTIDPARVSDRDGVPFCKNCYAREFGPGGIAGKR
ncbi:hypothetical protein CC85DRAFT_239152 [Cutaneotrichosporon oleaginosum]|uniref:LIM zinc-binding domain-containing protein n=1 Tax=Cutaneotrichosporon oleaginosum TaxID=879819 RepID=A0A0J0XYX2_9TREE|nr:uncharacterized protein CC85DRAFT_239152 [Cutaneotrichosporon oleaginosum]KLT46226.1 hypothetical protein CC85DRAFT_239152 [Cutaneotrichosporon oleaginosum]TXT10233.1 hypothetical protein COLE_04167 [Cutaneotrichosporon oleaginosum]